MSLACIPCRNRHVKCNAAKPTCSRCSMEGKECFYTRSKRGGLDRAALLRRRLETRQLEQPNIQPAIQSSSESTECPELAIPAMNSQLFDSFMGTNSENGSFGSLPILSHIGPQETLHPLIALYYEYFHGANPCVLPSRFLHQLCSSRRSEIRPLAITMQYIGSLYDQSTSSEYYKTQTMDILQSSAGQKNGFLVQARLIYAIALYWHDEREESNSILHEALQLAVDLGMHRSDFALSNCNGCLALAESWRRTWWLLYTTDAHRAAIERIPFFPAATIEADTGLPCEEYEYYSGVNQFRGIFIIKRLTFGL